MIDVKKKEGENANSLLFRFSKRVKRSGVLKEIKKRRFYGRSQNKNKRRSAALYRLEKAKTLQEIRKYGSANSQKNK